jgi:hypothetical protein
LHLRQRRPGQQQRGAKRGQSAERDDKYFLSDDHGNLRSVVTTVILMVPASSALGVGNLDAHPMRLAF